MAWRQTNLLVFLCLGLVFATTLSAQSAKDAESFLVNAEQRIHSDDFSIKDNKALELIELPAAESGRRLMLLARFRHHACGDTQGALELLASLIWPREAPSWIKTQRSARQLAVAAWERERAEAQRQQRDAPAPPLSVLVPALALLQSQVDAVSAEAVLEFARLLLLSSQRSDECGLMVDRVLELPESLATVLALELGAELKAENSDLEGAVYFCGLALDRLRRLSQSSGSNQYRSPTEREGLLSRRISGAREGYQKRLDIEHYGPGFVRYRDAERVRLSNGDMAVASGLYEAIVRDFPNTIWAEVAGCYRVKCLLALADERNQVRLADAAKRSQQRVDADKERLKELRQRGAPTAAERRLREQLAEAEQESSRLFALPRGVTAGNIAEREGDSFLRANLLGLYREETACDLARHALDRDLDAADAKRRYLAAWELIQRVEKNDVVIAGLAVPEKARAISMPPQERERSGFFGRVVRNQVPIGALLNRRTAPWYLDDLRQQIALGLSFLCFVQKDLAGARAWAKQVPEGMDIDVGVDGAMVSNQMRMNWAIDHGYIFAQPEELALAADERQRSALLLADFLYVSKNYVRCERLLDRLLENGLGKLTPAQRDYPLLAKAWCHYRSAFSAGEHGLEITERFIDELDLVLMKREGTMSERRAAWMLAQAAEESAREAVRQRGRSLMEELAAMPPTNRYALNARLALGVRCLRAGDLRRGGELLRSFPPNEKNYRVSGIALLKQYAPDQLTDREKSAP